jgi:hypothetical protein
MRESSHAGLARPGRAAPVPGFLSRPAAPFKPAAAAEMPIAEACGGEFTSRDGVEECDIVSVADAQSAGASSVVGGRPRDLVEQLG